MELDLAGVSVDIAEQRLDCRIVGRGFQSERSRIGHGVVQQLSGVRRIDRLECRDCLEVIEIRFDLRFFGFTGKNILDANLAPLKGLTALQNLRLSNSSGRRLSSLRVVAWRGMPRLPVVFKPLSGPSTVSFGLRVCLAMRSAGAAPRRLRDLGRLRRCRRPARSLIML